jgi:hypothetical protein
MVAPVATVPAPAAAVAGADFSPRAATPFRVVALAVGRFQISPGATLAVASVAVGEPLRVVVVVAATAVEKAVAAQRAVVVPVVAAAPSMSAGTRS